MRKGIAQINKIEKVKEVDILIGITIIESLSIMWFIISWYLYRLQDVAFNFLGYLIHLLA